MDEASPRQPPTDAFQKPLSALLPMNPIQFTISWITKDPLDGGRGWGSEGCYRAGQQATGNRGSTMIEKTANAQFLYSPRLRGIDSLHASLHLLAQALPGQRAPSASSADHSAIEV